MKVMLVSRGVPTDRNPLLGIFEYDQAKALAEYGHEVIFAVVDLRSIRRRRRLGIRSYRQDSIDIISISVPVGAVPAKIKDTIGKWAIRILYRRIKSLFGKPDIVHAHFLDMGVLAADLCRRENIPLVITEHSSSVNKESLPETTVKRLKFAYRSSEKVLAVGNALAESIKKYTGVQPVVLPNILNMPAPVQNIQSENPGGGLCFLSAGNLVERKGFDVLIEAFAIFAEAKPEASLLIMGGGPEEKRLKTQVKKLGLSDKITFYGPYQRLDFARELTKADVFVLATKLETFGVVFIEALSFGVPVIATRSGGPEDFVNESNGLLVDVDDVQGLAQAMISISENIGRYDKARIAASTRRRFSPEEIARRLTEIYENIGEKEHEERSLCQNI